MSIKFPGKFGMTNQIHAKFVRMVTCKESRWFKANEPVHLYSRSAGKLWRANWVGAPTGVGHSYGLDWLQRSSPKVTHCPTEGDYIQAERIVSLGGHADFANLISKVTTTAKVDANLPPYLDRLACIDERSVECRLFFKFTRQLNSHHCLGDL